MRAATSLLYLALACTTYLVADSGHWGRFRGYQGAGIAVANGAPEGLSLDSTLIWKMPLSPGKSSPILAGDRLFVTAWRGAQRMVLCLDRHSGKVLWERSITRMNTPTMNKLNDAAAPTPATDGTNVYAFFADFGLISYSVSGKQRWQTPMGPFSSVHGIGTSPIVSNGLVVLAIEQQTGGSSLTAFDAKSGSVRWRTELEETGQQGYGTPFVHAAPDGSPEIVYSRPGEIGGWSLATGKPTWGVRGTGTQTYSSPAVSEGVLYAAADGDTVEGAMQAWEQFLKKFNRSRERTLRVKEDWNDDTLARADRTFGNNDGVLDENEWRTFVRNNQPKSLVAVRLGGRGDVTNSHVLWRSSRAVPTVPSPVALGKVLFYVRDGGIFTSLDASTGKVLKEARLPGAADKFFASPVIGGDRIYVTSEAGKLIVIRAAAEWDVISVHDLGESIFATPAISNDGKLYVRTGDALYCFGRR